MARRGRGRGSSTRGDAAAATKIVRGDAAAATRIVRGQRWFLQVAPDPADPLRTLVAPAARDDPRPYFSFAVVRAQRLTLADAPPPGARMTFVRSEFAHPDPAALRAVGSPDFYAARLLAFASTVEALRPGLLAHAEAVL